MFRVRSEKQKYMFDSIRLQASGSVKKGTAYYNNSRSGVRMTQSRSRKPNVPSGPNQGDETRLKGRRGRKGSKGEGLRRERVSPSRQTGRAHMEEGTGTQTKKMHGGDREISSTARVFDRGSKNKRV